MKAKKFTLASREAMTNCIDFIVHQEWDGKVEVIIRNAKESKTLQQLGALFAVYVKYIANEINQDGDVDYVHRMLKAKFLARIYVENSATIEQENWVDLLAIYQMNNEQDKLIKHARRISLKWANMQQTKDYLDAIAAHYQNAGHPLPLPDPEWRYR